jgi:hypothetical protein
LLTRPYPNPEHPHMDRATTGTIHRIRRLSLRPAADESATLQGDALLKDMRVYRSRVTATQAKARKFLFELGVLTRDGKTKRLTRG